MIRKNKITYIAFKGRTVQQICIAITADISIHRAEFKIADIEFYNSEIQQIYIFILIQVT